MQDPTNTLFYHYSEPSDDGNVLFIQLRQDLKMENTPVFHEFFDPLFDAHIQKVLVDFSKIRFVDSTGLGVLIQYATTLQEKKGVFYITGLNRSLHSVFRLAGLGRVFEILDREHQAEEFPYLSFESLAQA